MVVVCSVVSTTVAWQCSVFVHHNGQCLCVNNVTQNDSYFGLIFLYSMYTSYFELALLYSTY